MGGGRVGVAAIVATLVGTDHLIGNLAWWHWGIIILTIVLSTQFALLDGLRRGIEKLSDYAIDGAGVSIRTGTFVALAVAGASLVIMTAAYDIETGITGAFGFGLFAASVLMGPVWVLAWGVAMLALYSSLSRYIARFIEADLIISEIGAMAWQAFALIALLGVGYGVREGVNPRIDFWWAEFSNRRKAWLDFVVHVTLFIPFLDHGHADPLGLRQDLLGLPSRSFWSGTWRHLATRLEGLGDLGTTGRCRSAADRTDPDDALRGLRAHPAPDSRRDDQTRVHPHQSRRPRRFSRTRRPTAGRVEEHDAMLEQWVSISVSSSP